MLRSFITRLVFCGLIIHSTPSMPTEIIDMLKDPSQYSVKAISKSIIISYLLSFVYIVGHELGHALTAKVLFKSPIRMVIGTNGFVFSPDAIPFTKSTIKFGGFFPGGATLVDDAYLAKASSLQKIAFYAAGPLSELATHWIISKNFNRLPFCHDMQIGRHYSLLLNLIPIKFNNMIATDGYRIMQEIRKIIRSYRKKRAALRQSAHNVSRTDSGNFAPHHGQ